MKHNISTGKGLAKVKVKDFIDLLLGGISQKKTFASSWRKFDKRLQVGDIRKATKCAQVCVNEYFVKHPFIWRFLPKQLCWDMIYKILSCHHTIAPDF